MQEPPGSWASETLRRHWREGLSFSSAHRLGQAWVRGRWELGEGPPWVPVLLTQPPVVFTLEEWPATASLPRPGPQPCFSSAWSTTHITASWPLQGKGR